MQQETAVSSSGNPGNTISILAVVAAENAAEIRRIVSHTRWQLHVVNSIEAAMQALRASSCTVVLCEATLSDGRWKDLIRKAKQMRPHPETIVLSPTADSALWGEVLNWGGYDLLQMPLEPQELYSTVPMAWRQCISKAEKTRNPAIELSPARELTKVS